MLEEEELPDVSFSSDSVPIEKSVNKPLRVSIEPTWVDINVNTIWIFGMSERERWKNCNGNGKRYACA